MKNVWKRALSAALALVMCVSLCLPVGAAKVNDAAPVTVTIGSGTIAAAGEELSVPVTIAFADDEVAVSTVALQFAFDNALTLTKLDTGTVKAPTLLKGAQAGLAKKSIAWTTADEEVFLSNATINDEDIYGTDILLNLVFTVADGYKNDAHTVTCDVINGDEYNFARLNDAVNFRVVDGTITLTGGKDKDSVAANMFTVGAAPEYTGSVLTADITSTLDAANYTVSGNTATNAGKYTATITGKNEYQGSVEVEWEIAPKTVDSVDWADLTLTYNGKTQIPTASFEGVGADGKIAVKVEGNGVNVGAYTATAVSAENANYKLAAGLTQEYAIEPSDKVNAVVEAEQKVAIGENAELKAPQFTGFGDEKVEGKTLYLMGYEVVPDAAVFDSIYALKYDAVNDELAKLEKGTTDTIAYRFQASGNYKAELFGLIKVEMVDILFKIGDELVTDATAVSIKETIEYGDNWADAIVINDIKAFVGSNEIEGKFALNLEGSAEVGSIDYTVTFVGGGYEMTVATGTVTVVPKTVAVVWENTKLTYTGEAQAPKAYYMDVKGERVDVTVKADQAINVGEYNAIAFGDDANYTLTNTQTAFQIAPAKVELVVEVYSETGYAAEGVELVAVVTEADKYEVLTYSWFMDGEKIEGADAATYTVSNAEPYTEITVVATVGGNYAGEATETVMVIAAPEAPKLTASKIGSTYVTLTWDAPENNGSDIESYSVKVNEDGEWLYDIAKDAEYTFENLVKGETYTFFVMAKNEAGYGDVASIGGVKTKVPTAGGPIGGGGGGSSEPTEPTTPTEPAKDVTVEVPAATTDAPVALPIDAVKVGDDTQITVNTKSETPVKVEIPVVEATEGTVAVLIKADGTEQIIRDSVVTENGVVVSVSDGDKIVIKDNSKQFNDVGNHWGAKAVNFVAARGLFAGTGNGNFAPDVTTNRAMVVQVLHNLEYNAAFGTDHSFPDVTDAHWYDNAVAWAAEKQIVSGYGDGSFQGEKQVSREELVVMLWNYAGKKAATDSSRVNSFNDATNVSDWAKDAMNWALENGVLSGKGGNLLDPTGMATRAELAQMMKNYLENI